MDKILDKIISANPNLFISDSDEIVDWSEWRTYFPLDTTLIAKLFFFVQALMRAGFVPRWVHPSNIVLTRSGRIKISPQYGHLPGSTDYYPLIVADRLYDDPLMLFFDTSNPESDVEYDYFASDHLVARINLIRQLFGPNFMPDWKTTITDPKNDYWTIHRLEQNVKYATAVMALCIITGKPSVNIDKADLKKVSSSALNAVRVFMSINPLDRRDYTIQDWLGVFLKIKKMAC